MNSGLKPGKARLNTVEIVLLGLFGAIMMGVQVALSALPNIELVSFLVILLTLTFGRRVLYPIYIFAFLEGLIYGFSIWWSTYLYVWTVLAGIAWLFRRVDSALGWALISGAYGLLFGALCEIPWLITSGPRAAFAAWIVGIPFDLVHCVGNFAIALLLYRPFIRLLRMMSQQILCRPMASDHRSGALDPRSEAGE